MIVLRRFAAAVSALVVVGLLTASTCLAAGGEAGRVGRPPVGLRPPGAPTALAIVQTLLLSGLLACVVGLAISAVRSVVLHHHST